MEVRVLHVLMCVCVRMCEHICVIEAALINRDLFGQGSMCLHLHSQAHHNINSPAGPGPALGSPISGKARDLKKGALWGHPPQLAPLELDEQLFLARIGKYPCEVPTFPYYFGHYLQFMAICEVQYHYRMI